MNTACSMADDQEMQGRISENPGPGNAIEPEQGSVVPFPVVNDGEKQTQLREQGKWPVQMRGDKASLTCDSRYGGQTITGEGPDLKPEPLSLLLAAHHRYKRPGEAHDHDQQEQRKQRPPDPTIQHGAGL